MQFRNQSQRPGDTAAIDQNLWRGERN